MLEMRENVIMTAKGQLHGRGFAAGPHIEQSILSEHGAFLVFSHLFFFFGMRCSSTIALVRTILVRIALPASTYSTCLRVTAE